LSSIHLKNLTYNFLFSGFPSAIGTSVIATIMVPKAMLATVLVDKMGRRTLLMVRL